MAASALALLLSAACALLWLMAAALRGVLGAPGAGFFAVLLTPFLVGARWAAHLPTSAGWALALGVLLIGAVWQLAAPHLKRRGGDAIFASVIAFEIFWVLRWYNSRLAPAGAPAWSDLSGAQQASLALGVLLCAFLLAAWLLLPAARASYDSAPSRVTGFMKKKRMPSRIAGAVLMALVIVLVGVTAFHLSENPGQPVLLGLLSTPLLFGLWLALDALYCIGRKMWRRLT